MNDYSELRASMDALRTEHPMWSHQNHHDECSMYPCNVNVVLDGATALLDEVERLRAVLGAHGEHGRDCPGISDWEECDCGFTAAYSGAALNSSTGQQNAPVAGGDPP